MLLSISSCLRPPFLFQFTLSLIHPSFQCQSSCPISVHHPCCCGHFQLPSLFPATFSTPPDHLCIHPSILLVLPPPFPSSGHHSEFRLFTFASAHYNWLQAPVSLKSVHFLSIPASVHFPMLLPLYVLIFSSFPTSSHFCLLHC